MRTSSASESAHIFSITHRRCTFTVFSVHPKRAPTCLLSRPTETASNTWPRDG